MAAKLALVAVTRCNYDVRIPNEPVLQQLVAEEGQSRVRSGSAVAHWIRSGRPRSEGIQISCPKAWNRLKEVTERYVGRPLNMIWEAGYGSSVKKNPVFWSASEDWESRQTRQQTGWNVTRYGSFSVPIQRLRYSDSQGTLRSLGHGQGR